jgi:S-adenosylmethionine hydrolase
VIFAIPVERWDVITLASDFGSPYPAAMRGVMRRRTDAELLDLSHAFPRQDVRAAAFWLRELVPYVPPAVHCVVVDPGVGTDRRAIVLRVGEHAFVGPDNGVLDPVARTLRRPPPAAGTGLSGLERATEDQGAEVIEAFEILVEDPESSTFHGRDVFAPAAAAVHETGVDSLTECPFLSPIDEYVDLRLPTCERYGEGAIGTALVVDEFGNAITNLPGDLIEGRDSVRVNDEPVPVGGSFAAVPEGQWLVTVGSHGNVELAVNQGRGDEAFHVAPGDRVWLEFTEDHADTNAPSE